MKDDLLGPGLVSISPDSSSNIRFRLEALQQKSKYLINKTLAILNSLILKL